MHSRATLVCLMATWVLSCWAWQPQVVMTRGERAKDPRCALNNWDLAPFPVVLFPGLVKSIPRSRNVPVEASKRGIHPRTKGAVRAAATTVSADASGDYISPARSTGNVSQRPMVPTFSP